MQTVLFFVKILATARRNRITFGTQMNQHSSRSHALLCITVQGTDLATGSKTTGQSHSHIHPSTGKAFVNTCDKFFNQIWHSSLPPSFIEDECSLILNTKQYFQRDSIVNM